MYKKLLKKAYISIEVVLIGTVVILFGVVCVGARARMTNETLTSYEKYVQEEIEKDKK